MLNILFVFSLIYNQINCKSIDEQVINKPTNIEYKSEILSDNNEYKLDPGKSITLPLDYQISTPITFNIKENDTILINIHAINCYFEIEYNGIMMKQLDLDKYSLKISSENNTVIITPLLDVIDGEYKEDYGKKTCSLSINSYVLNNNSTEAELKIENKEESYLYFAPEEYNLLKISYDIKEVFEDSYAGLFFQFNEKTDFEINITYKSEQTEKFREEKISNSTTILLDSSFLLYDSKTKRGGRISISINNTDRRAVLMRFKIIEKDSISLLQKNALNFGFLTSKTTYQYFYTEVLPGEEGELILHKKRTYGLLYGKIVSKSEIKKDELKDTSIYPNKDTDNTTILDYNYHTLKLYFNFLNTSQCEEGCYLLVTFEQKIAEGELPLIGSEISILTRFWNYTDYISEIVDIPFNEYLIGSFDKGSISHHYYSVFIPEDADKIIIQIESNYLDGFIGEGRLKINTEKQIGNTEKLEIINNQNVFILDVTKKNLKGKDISFAFRSIDYFAEIFSYYYFRVLYFKANEEIYYPMDSNLGNLCKPQINNDNGKYYCNFIFNNNYNELSRKFAISSSILNELYTIYATKVYKNKTVENPSKQFVYVDLDSNEDIDYYLFQIEFENDELKNIMSSVLDNVTDLYPQIYSYQMFFIADSYKLNHFKNVNKYTFMVQYVYGYAGSVSINFFDNEKFNCSKNIRGKPISIAIDSETDAINCSTIMTNFAYFIKLHYNRENKVVEEINSGEIYSQFIPKKNFPLFFYLKTKSKNFSNVNVNIRINSYIDEDLRNSFQIRAYILDEDTVQRKINGESIQLNEPFIGNYSDTFKIGLLQIKRRSIINSENSILIEIINDDIRDEKDYLLVELISKEYNEEKYFLPINQYLFETFKFKTNESFEGENNETSEISTENKYYLTCGESYGDYVLIDFSSAYDDIKINFSNSTGITEYNSNGFKKYKISNNNDDNVYFSVINSKNRTNVNYMIRYHYSSYEYIYSINDQYINKEYPNNENATITITYNPIKVKTKHDNKDVNNENIIFNIYAFLFQKLNESNKTSDEKLNTASMLVERKYLFHTNTTYNYRKSNSEKLNIIFENIPRNKNYKYELQLQVNAKIKNNIFNEEFLIFTSDIDLTDIEYIDKRYIYYLIIGLVIVAIIISLVIFFIVKYKRLQKSNVNLKEDLKSMAYSNDVQKNVLNKEQQSSQKESDYDSTFI